MKRKICFKIMGKGLRSLLVDNADTYLNMHLLLRFARALMPADLSMFERNPGSWNPEILTFVLCRLSDLKLGETA